MESRATAIEWDPHHLRQEMAMLTRAIKNGWPVPEEKIQDAHRKASAVMIGAADPRLRAAAEKLLEAIEGR